MLATIVPRYKILRENKNQGKKLNQVKKLDQGRTLYGNFKINIKRC